MCYGEVVLEERDKLYLGHIRMFNQNGRYWTIDAYAQVVVEVVILFPEEYNIIHSIHTTFQQFHKCIPLAVAREAQYRTMHISYSSEAVGVWYSR